MLRKARNFQVSCKCATRVFLKGTLGVKRATTNWAILRDCGHVPLQFYWFKSAIKMYNGLLNSNCETLRKILKEDLHLHSRTPSCWTAQILDRFQGLQRCESFVTAMKPISLQDFTDDLRHRLRAVEKC
eukprot:1142962-Pelagomonas_calceolata.AAC.1